MVLKQFIRLLDVGDNGPSVLMDGILDNRILQFLGTRHLTIEDFADAVQTEDYFLPGQFRRDVFRSRGCLALVRYIDAAAHLFTNDIAKILEREHHDGCSTCLFHISIIFLMRPGPDAVVFRKDKPFFRERPCTDLHEFLHEIDNQQAIFSFLSLCLILLSVFTECGHSPKTAK